MSEPDPPPLESPSGTDPLVVATKRPRDRVLPILIVGSLIVHALVFLPSLLWPRPDRANAPHEIPVEVVQEAPASQSPPPAAPPSPETSKPEPPKPEPPKPEPPKPEPSKPEPPKPEPPKPEPPKPAEEAKQPPTDPSRGNVAQRMKDLLGAMPAIALPGEDPAGSDEVSYEQLVLSKLRKAKNEGRHEGIPGVAFVEFVLDDGGGIASASVAHSSGDPALDKEAVAMVYRGAPYPPPPPGARRDFTFGLRFSQLR